MHKLSKKIKAVIIDQYFQHREDHPREDVEVISFKALKGAMRIKYGKDWKYYVIHSYGPIQLQL